MLPGHSCVCVRVCVRDSYRSGMRVVGLEDIDKPHPHLFIQHVYKELRRGGKFLPSSGETRLIVLVTFPSASGKGFMLS